jgi:GNAT superfamily N-acetyltransferase
VVPGREEAAVAGLEPEPIELVFRPATPGRWRDLEALFGPNGACAGCWCMFWKQTNAEFRAGKGARNRRTLRRAVASGEVPGLLAYAGREPVGWVAVEPRARYARLAVSRSLPAVDDQPVWSAPCFFVARAWRGRGVAGQLLAAAAEHVRRRGGRILEGYPIDSDRPMAGAWLYPGAHSTFVRQGFREVARLARTRPVMRLALARGARRRAAAGRGRRARAR